MGVDPVATASRREIIHRLGTVVLAGKPVKSLESIIGILAVVGKLFGLEARIDHSVCLEGLLVVPGLMSGGEPPLVANRGEDAVRELLLDQPIQDSQSPLYYRVVFQVHPREEH